MLEIAGQSAVFYPLSINGAPRNAYIRGINGDWVLVAQGFGYEVFNYKTHSVESSDPNGTPGATTHIQYSGESPH